MSENHLSIHDEAAILEPRVPTYPVVQAMAFNRAESELIWINDRKHKRSRIGGTLWAVATTETDECWLIPVDIKWESRSGHDAVCAVNYDQAYACDRQGRVLSNRTLPTEESSVRTSLDQLGEVFGAVFNIPQVKHEEINVFCTLLDKFIDEAARNSTRSRLSQERRELPDRMHLEAGLFHESDQRHAHNRRLVSREVYQHVSKGHRHVYAAEWQDACSEMQQAAQIHKGLCGDKSYRKAVVAAVKDNRKVAKERGFSASEAFGTQKKNFFGFGQADSIDQTLAALESAMQQAAHAKHYDEAREIEIIRAAKEIIGHTKEVLGQVPAYSREMERLSQALDQSREGRVAEQTLTPFDRDSLPTPDHDLGR